MTLKKLKVGQSAIIRSVEAKEPFVSIFWIWE